MPNNRFNKQVTPKGYKAGGKVLKEEPMRDRKKQPLRTKSGGTKGKPNLFDPAFKSKKRKTEGFKMGGRAKKMFGGMMKRPMMKKGGVASEAKKKQFKENKAGQKSFNKKAMKVAKTIGKIVIPGGMAIDTGVKLAKRVGKKMGGSLKPVNPQTQKGLSKLPTEVRNKMGYMKKGGMVPNKKYIKKSLKN